MVARFGQVKRSEIPIYRGTRPVPTKLTPDHPSEYVNGTMDGAGFQPLVTLSIAEIQIPVNSANSQSRAIQFSAF